jgi:hypothetical protein
MFSSLLWPTSGIEIGRRCVEIPSSRFFTAVAFRVSCVVSDNCVS